MDISLRYLDFILKNIFSKVQNMNYNADDLIYQY